MKIAFAFLFMMIGCGNVVAQSKEVAIEDLKWVAVVSESEASFTFPPTNKENFSWYKRETPTDNLEYTWSVIIGDDKSGYEFGPVLFKPGGTRPRSGSLSDLIKACQQSLWHNSADGGDNIGDYGNANVKGGKVRIKINDGALIKKLFEAKPKTVEMTIYTPSFNLSKHVSVTYGE